MQTGEVRNVEEWRAKWQRWLIAMREAQNAMHRAPVTPADPLARAQELRAAGKPWRAVSAEVGVPVATLRRKLGVAA